MNAHLHVDAGVRYWEDARVNGIEDADGSLIPFRKGDRWQPVIDLATGTVIDWPAGMTADICYKVCDDGSYWIAQTYGDRKWKWAGDYVPDRWLCHGDTGYGDYIILVIGPDGRIANWNVPEFCPDKWVAVTN